MQIKAEPKPSLDGWALFLVGLDGGHFDLQN